MTASVVEFVGLPGSGKSTIAVRTVAALRERAVDVANPTYENERSLSTRHRRARKLRLASLQCLRRPSYGVRTLAGIRRSDQRSLGRTVTTTVNWLYVSSLLRRAARRDRMTVLDQGLLQALWSVRFSADGSVTELEPIVRRAYREAPDTLIVHVDVSPQTAIQRLRNRTGGFSAVDPESSRSVSDAVAALESVQRFLDELEAELSGLRSVSMANERDRDVERCARRIVRELTDRERRDPL